MVTMTSLIYVAVGISAIGLPILGLCWLLATLARSANGKKMFRNCTLTALGVLIVTGALSASDILPNSQEFAALKREEEAHEAALKRKEEAQEAARTCDDHIAAYVATWELVKLRLRSPASADFPLFDFRHTKVGPCQFAINSYVDSQNGFGAMIRSYYSAIVEHDSGQWNLVSLEFSS